MKHLAYEILTNQWLVNADHIDMYARMANDFLAGRKVETGFFAELQLPDVPNNMALVAMVGVLTKSDICASQGSRTLTSQIAAAASNPNINAIILLSESCPGGTVEGTEEFANAIKAANEKKPVVGVISDMACSAAVWALSGCSEIYSTSNTALVGCIGTMARIRNKKEGNNSEVEVIADVTPDKNSESRDTAQHKERILNPTAVIFQKAVMEGRGSRLKMSKEDVLTGKTYIASAAAEYGLIDGVMSFNKIIQRANFLSKKRN